MKAFSRMVALLAAALACSTCAKNSSTSPSTLEVSSFATGVTAADGSVAQLQRGSPPVPSGGPDITATSPGTVSSGGTDLVRLRASASFQTVYVSVDGADGFFQLPLAAPTTDITITTALAPSIPSASYTALYRAQSSSGAVGSPASVTNTVQGGGNGGGGTGGGGGSTTTTWNVTFPLPGLKLSPCSTASFTSQVISVDATGSAHGTWEGIIQADGTLTTSSVAMTLTCIGGPSSGSISAAPIGAGYAGTATFNGFFTSVQITKQ
jgi:hypothetical protein